MPNLVVPGTRILPYPAVAEDIEGEIPNYDWNTPVRNSPHLGKVTGPTWYLKGEVVVVRTWRSFSESGPCLGYLAVSDADEMIKFFTMTPILGWRATARLLIHGTREEGVRITRHDTNPKTGMKSTVIRDVTEEDGTFLRWQKGMDR